MKSDSREKYIKDIFALFKKYSSDIKLEDKNILENFGIQNLESSFSYVIKYLLERKNFLKLFLNKLKKSSKNKNYDFDFNESDEILVILEKQEKGNRPDLWIKKNGKLWFILENKVWSGELKKGNKWQTEQYSKNILEKNERSFGIFLTIAGNSAKSSKFLPYDYRTISKIIDQVVDDVESKDKDFLNEFNQNLKKNILPNNFFYLKELEFLKPIIENPRLYEQIHNTYIDLYTSLVVYYEDFIHELLFRQYKEFNIRPIDNENEYEKIIPYTIKIKEIKIKIGYSHDDRPSYGFKWSPGQLYIFVEGETLSSNLNGYNYESKNGLYYMLFNKGRIPHTHEDMNEINDKIEKIINQIKKL